MGQIYFTEGTAPGTPASGEKVIYVDSADGVLKSKDDLGAVTSLEGGGLANVVDDTTPQLGGNLDVNGKSIVSVAAGNIAITPDTTGDVILDGLKWPQADGTLNQVLKTDGAGQLSWTTPAGGGDALTSSNLDQFADVTQTAGKTLAITDNTTLAGGSHSGTNTGDQTSVSGNAGTVTIGSEGADTTCFPLFATAETGSLSPKTNASLKFNASTCEVEATTFKGALTGNVTGDCSGSSGSCTGNAATATSATSATTATTATNATNVTIAAEAADTTCFPLFVTDSTPGNLPPKVNTGLTFNASTGALGASNLSGTNTGDVTLAGTPDYITITGQQITRNAVDLAADVTGTLPVANGGTGITSFGSGVATWLGTPSSANLATAVTDETGSGALVFGTGPTLDCGGSTSVEIPNGAGGTTLDAAGEVCVDTTTKTLNFYSDAEYSLNPLKSKSISIEDPTNAEDITLFYTEVAITIRRFRAVLVGSSTPSVTWTIRHSDTTRSNAGTEAVTSGTTTTSTTTGDNVTSFNDATAAAGWVWLETTAKSGTVDELHVTIEYTEDP